MVYYLWWFLFRNLPTMFIIIIYFIYFIIIIIYFIYFFVYNLDRYYITSKVKNIIYYVILYNYYRFLIRPYLFTIIIIFYFIYFIYFFNILINFYLNFIITLCILLYFFNGRFYSLTEQKKEVFI